MKNGELLGKFIRYDKELKEKIIKEYISGKSMVALAKKYDMTDITISRWLLRAQIPIRDSGHYRKVIKKDLKFIHVGYKSGGIHICFGKIYLLKLGIPEKEIFDNNLKYRLKIRKPNKLIIEIEK